MIETRQSLADSYYLLLLGEALYVFNSNNSFVIENILRVEEKENWYELMNLTSGKLKSEIQKVEVFRNDEELVTLFSTLKDQRNRIIHSYPVTDIDGHTHILRTNDKSKKQYNITEKYLCKFIKENEKLCLMLHELRG